MFIAYVRSYGVRAIGWFCFAALAAGCSKSTKPELTPVSGTVTLDGKPLADAQLTFYLQGERVPGYVGSVGKTDAGGKYQLTSGGEPGAVAGDFKVTVSRIVGENGAPVNLAEGMDLMQLEMQGLAKQSLLQKYWDLDQSELSAKVEKGKAEGYDFQLSGS